MDTDLNLSPWSVAFFLVGSTFGLTLRMFLNNRLKIESGFYINNTSLVNYLSAFFLGILVALNQRINNASILFCSGFLGCFSTFSSFVYQLFTFFQKRQLILLMLYYIKIIFVSLILFYLGFYLIKLF